MLPAILHKLTKTVGTPGPMGSLQHRGSPQSMAVVDLGSLRVRVLGRVWVDQRSTRGRPGVDLRSILGRSGVYVRSIRGAFVIAPGPILGAIRGESAFDAAFRRCFEVVSGVRRVRRGQSPDDNGLGPIGVARGSIGGACRVDRVQLAGGWGVTGVLPGVKLGPIHANMGSI